ncbi:hypothetical protein Pmani_016901 [Petrolisthes manimaculis]|uniref:Uncharacterized protein n=1 Tax=Petrolisthes manimaculis TaxID=1843537 RepID=A0AAE1UAH0_9EUCA|nr:hypothetical protein Pmani_016901 [Petrolisthes manimaculis]
MEITKYVTGLMGLIDCSIDEWCETLEWNEKSTDASQLGLDSSIEESVGKGEQLQIPTSSKKSSVPQRASRRIRNTTRSPSYEYEPLKLMSRKESENDDVWQPSSYSKRVPRTTRKSTRKAKPSAPPNPYLKDQENKSSLANKATDDDQLQPTEEDKPLSKKPAQRKTRQLYQTDHLEPYECTAVKDAPEVVDSPHNVVRRQLRNKRKYTYSLSFLPFFPIHLNNCKFV